jgi:Ca2+-binding RTX toxin-like protein
MAALQHIYDGSPGLAATVDAWLNAHPGTNIVIHFLANNAQGIVNGGVVNIDPAFFTSNAYVTLNGTIAADTFESGLTHELGHAVGGWYDNESFSNLAGDNATNVNPWFAQLGYGQQSSYEAYYSPLDPGVNVVLTPGASYTAGAAIKNAIIDRGLYQNGPFMMNSGNIDLALSGVTGSTLVIGGSGTNTYTGTTSRDWLYGNDGTDTLNGGGGSDFLYGGAGNDTLKGGEGDDEIWGGDNPLLPSGLTDGNDTIEGGAGKDKIYGGNGNDIVTGGAGDDEIWGGDKGIETNPSGESDAASYTADTRPVTIRYDGSGTIVTIKVTGGTSGTDTLHSVEKIVGTTGRDIVNIVGQIATGTDLTIDANGGQGANPRDTINLSKSTVGGTVTLDALGAGTISTGANQDIHLIGFHTGIVGSAFSDTIVDSSSGDKEIDGGAGDDTLSIAESDGAGVLVGGAGNDTITGGSGNDIIFGGAANHPNDVWPADDSIYLYGNQLSGGDGNDRIYSSSLLDHINGGAGNDYISVAWGMLFTSWGGTIVDGGTGNDVIRLDPYRDRQSGGEATVILRADSGHDTVIGEFAHRSSSGNAITQAVDVQLEGLTYEDLQLIWDVPELESGQSFSGRGDLVIKVKSTGASILIRNAYGTNNTGTVDRFRFDGVTINNLDFIYYSGPGSGNLGWIISGDTSAYDVAEGDFLDGTALPPGSSTGGSGNDVLSGGTGNDTLSGGEGDDIFHGSPGNDQIQGGAGEDTLELFGRWADFTVSGGGGEPFTIVDNRGLLGAMTLTSVENVYFVSDGNSYQINALLSLFGTAGDDTIVGTSLSDRIFGLAGNDIVEGGGGDDQIDGGDGTDVLRFAGSSSEYAISYSNNTYTITGPDASGEIGTTDAKNIEEIQFLGDGTLLDLVHWSLVGTAGDDTMTGGAEGFALRGLAGNDILIGGPSGLLDGGDGDDILRPSGSNDVQGGDGNDQVQFVGASTDYLIARTPDGAILLYGFGNFNSVDGVESFYFAADNVTLTVDDLPPLGTSADDTITGTPRADGLYGLEGNDTLLGCAGADFLDGGAGGDAMSGGTGDDFYYVDDVADAVSELAAEGHDGVEAVIGYVLPDNVEDLRLAWDAGAIDGSGNGLDNRIEGSGDSNVLRGLAGDDIIGGYGGDDLLIGGAGDDVYIFGAYEGADIVDDYGDGTGGVGGSDSIEFYDEYVTPADVIVSQTNNGNDFVLTVAGAGTITLQGSVLDTNHRIEQVRFADGTIWSHSDLMALSTSGTGFASGVSQGDAFATTPGPHDDLIFWAGDSANTTAVDEEYADSAFGFGGTRFAKGADWDYGDVIGSLSAEPPSYENAILFLTRADSVFL